MHITFQFPIVDFRLLLDDNSRLLVPTWPTPDTSNNGFIRNFGNLQERYNGGIDGFSGEGVFCNARSSIRYPALQAQGMPINNGTRTTIQSINRRFFSDGRFMNKIEASFADDTEDAFAANNGKVEIDAVLRHYADLPVIVKGRPDAGKQLKLVRAGKPLSQLYCNSSTFYSKLNSNLSQYVVSGEVCIVVITWDVACVQIPPHAVEIVEDDLKVGEDEIKLYGYRLKHDGASFKTWIIVVPRSENEDGELPADLRKLLRSLRINLMRTHAEKEAIRILLNGVNTKRVAMEKGSRQAEAIESYLKIVSEKLFKKRRFDINQRNILDFALQSEEAISPGSFSSLEENIYYFTDQFVRKNLNQIINVMGDNITTTGNNNNVVTRSEIHDSFNTITKYHGPEVAKAVTALKEHVDQSGNKDAQEAVTLMTGELEKKEPNKSLLKTIWNGIVAIVPTVKTIAEIATVITALF